MDSNSIGQFRKEKPTFILHEMLEQLNPPSYTFYQKTAGETGPKEGRNEAWGEGSRSAHDTCLTLGTTIRCCTISVWPMDAIRVKASSLAESLHTRFSRALVCCFVSSFFRHSSVMYGTDSLPSS